MDVTLNAASHSSDHSVTVGGYLESPLSTSAKQGQEEPDEWKQVMYIIKLICDVVNNVIYVTLSYPIQKCTFYLPRPYSE